MKTAIAALAGGLLMAGAAQAKVNVYEFTGKVSTILEANNVPVGATSYPGVTLEVGDLFHGYLIYDTDTLKLSGTATSAVYANESVNAIHFGLTYDRANYSYDYPGDIMYLRMTVQNGTPDTVKAETLSLEMNGSQSLSFYFINNAGTAFTSLALPQSLALSPFDRATATYTWKHDDGRSATVRGDLLTLVPVTPVPEPATWGMLLGGLAVLALRRKAS